MKQELYELIFKYAGCRARCVTVHNPSVMDDLQDSWVDLEKHIKKIFDEIRASKEINK